MNDPRETAERFGHASVEQTAAFAAEVRLAQYGQRTSTWSTATYNDGTEKALHEIALGLKEEVDRLRAELAGERERYTAGLRKADEHLNAMSEELKRYANGDEQPVPWSVYNAMHSRAATAEGCITSVLALCDRAEKQATRWEHPLPVPEWVAEVRAAAAPAARSAAV